MGRLSAPGRLPPSGIPGSMSESERHLPGTDSEVTDWFKIRLRAARCQGRRHSCKSMLLHYLHCLHQTSMRALWNGVHTPPTAELILNRKNLQMSRASKKMNAFLEESCDLKEDGSCSSPGKVSEYNWRLQKLACFQGLDLHNC